MVQVARIAYQNRILESQSNKWYAYGIKLKNLTTFSQREEVILG